MGFFKKSSRQNYDIWSGYSWYVPGVAGMFALLGWLLVGALAGNIVASVFLFIPGLGDTGAYANIVAYPIMFIPAMIYAKMKSNRNMMFEKGVAIDSDNYGRTGGWLAAAAAIVSTLALAFNMDAVNRLMPPMPEMLENMLNSLVKGDFWLNFLSVSIFAPIFEEWLCRGMVLRGLLNATRPDGSTMKPAWAIIISSLFFAVIHMNPWQAIPAFALGCLFGYVYYRTGSLKLTMLMHFTNNTFALIMSQSGILQDAEDWLDLMPAWLYWIIFAAFTLLIALIVRVFARIPSAGANGGCREIPEGEIDTK